MSFSFFESSNERRLFTGVFLIKFFVFALILFIFGQGHFLWGDSAVFTKSARILQESGIYDDSRRTPLYTILLALSLWLSSNYSVAILVGLQMIVASLSAVFLYRIALFFVKNSYAILVALIFAFEPLSAIINMLVLAETFLVMFLLIGIWQFLQYYKNFSTHALIFSAVAFAGALWTKPVVTYLYIVPICFLLFAIRNKSHAILFGLVYFVSILPWMIFAYTHFHFFGISSQGENNVCGYMLTSVYSTEYRTDPSNMDSNLFPKDFEMSQQDCVSAGDAIKISLKKYPASFIKTLFLSTISMVTNDGYTSLFQGKSAIKLHNNYLTPLVFVDKEWMVKITLALRELAVWQLVVVFLAKIFWFCIFFSAMVGIWRGIKTPQHQKGFLFLVSVVIYFVVVTVVSTGFGVGARLRYPIVPFELFFAVYYLQSVGLLDKIKKYL